MSFFRTNLGSEGMAPPSQPVAASPPIPSSLYIANNPLLVVSTTTPSYSPSSKYTLQASTSAAGAMCGCFAALPFHLSLIVCHHMSEVEYTTKAECLPVKHLLQRPLLL